MFSNFENDIFQFFANLSDEVESIIWESEAKC